MTPKVVNELRFLSERIWTRVGVTPYASEYEAGIEEIVDQEIKKIILVHCKENGHEFVSDQCGRKEHDFCINCGIVREDYESSK